MAKFIEVVPFHGHEISTVREGDLVEVALKPLVEAMGLAWHGQFERVKRHPVLSEGIRVTRIPSGGGVQESVVISLEMLPGFLVTMQSERIADPEVRARVVLFQREAFHVLFEHFFGGRARGGAMALPGTKDLIGVVQQLRGEREPSVRAMFHAHLARICDRLELPLPPIEAIGSAAPSAEELVAPFFEALAEMEAEGAAINHSADPGLLAINMPEVRRLLRERGEGPGLTPDLRSALRGATDPAFVAANHPVASALRRKTVRCWVFRPGLLLDLPRPPATMPAPGRS